MILKSIKLEHIRSYINEKIDFPEGSVLLSGDIGSGKSTILLAIEFALFGLRRKHLPGLSLLRHGKNNGSVELSFSVNSKQVTIKRNLKRKIDVAQDTGYIIIDGIKKEGTAVELKSIILDLLGYPQSLLTKTKSLVYRYTVYTPQEEMKAILLEDKEERLDTLRKVFGFDKYKRVRENSQIITKVIRDKVNLLKGKAENIEEKKTKAEELRNQIRELDTIIDGITLELEQIKNNITQKANEKQEFEVKTNELHTLKKDLEILQTRLNEKISKKEENLNKLKDIDEKIRLTEEKLKDVEIKNENFIEDEIKQKEIQIDSLLKKQYEIKSKLDFIDDKTREVNLFLDNNKFTVQNIDDKKLKLSELNKKVKLKLETQEKYKEVIDKISSFNLKINEFSISKQNSEKVKAEILNIGKCPTCKQNVSKEHKMDIRSKEESNIRLSDKKINEFQVELHIAVKKKSDLEIKLTQILDSEKLFDKTKLELESLEKLQKEIESNKTLQKTLETRKTNILKEKQEFEKTNIEKIRQEIENKRLILKQIREKRSILALIDQRQELKQEIEKSNQFLEEEINRLTQENTSLNEKIDSFKDVEQKFIEIKQQLEEFKTKQQQIEIKFAEKRKELESVNNILELINKEIQEKQEAKDKINKLTNLKNWIDDYFLKLMLTIENQVMLRVYSEFNDLFKNWFDMLIESEVINARLDREFTPVIEQNGYETFIENLSGGEKTACALAYRLALNKVINDLQAKVQTKDIIILDEPTDGFSTEQLDKVRDVINELDMKQVIIVSHESKIEGFVDSVLRIEKREHVSSIIS